MTDKNPLFEFYKELYFHEIDVREALNARVQIPLAIIVSLIGSIAFMILSYDKNIYGLLDIIFVTFLALNGIALIICVQYLVRSWIGHTYSFLPTARDTDSYHKTLIETYSDYEDNKELVQKYLDEYVCNFYIKSSTNNTNCNDKRSLLLHKSNKYLVSSIALTAFTFLVFYIGEFDKTRVEKPIESSIVNPVKIEEANMADDNKKEPPPPPPPPPERLIKEGVEINPPRVKKDD